MEVAPNTHKHRDHTRTTTEMSDTSIASNICIMRYLGNSKVHIISMEKQGACFRRCKDSIKIAYIQPKKKIDPPIT